MASCSVNPWRIRFSNVTSWRLTTSGSVSVVPLNALAPSRWPSSSVRTVAA